MRIRYALRQLLRAAACVILVSLWTRPVLLGAQSLPSPTATAGSPLPVPTASSALAVLDQFAAAWAGVTPYTATVMIAERKDTG
jgi:hypothetical protein